MDKIIQVANISQETRNRVNPNDGRVYSPKGLSPTINTMGGGLAYSNVYTIKRS